MNINGLRCSCGKRFTARKPLEDHLRSASKRHAGVCFECELEFTSRRDYWVRLRCLLLSVVIHLLTQLLKHSQCHMKRQHPPTVEEPETESSVQELQDTLAVEEPVRVPVHISRRALFPLHASEPRPYILLSFLPHTSSRTRLRLLPRPRDQPALHCGSLSTIDASWNARSAASPLLRCL